jgi:hypothetical protein
MAKKQTKGAMILEAWHQKCQREIDDFDSFPKALQYSVARFVRDNGMIVDAVSNESSFSRRPGGGDGYWVYLKPGYHSNAMGPECHLMHEWTYQDLASALAWGASRCEEWCSCGVVVTDGPLDWIKDLSQPVDIALARAWAQAATDPEGAMVRLDKLIELTQVGVR